MPLVGYTWLVEDTGRIVNLLNDHLIRLVNDNILYVIRMQKDREDKVHGDIFEETKGDI